MVFFGSRSNEFNVAPRRSLETSLLLALLQNRFEEILALFGENDLASLSREYLVAFQLLGIDTG